MPKVEVRVIDAYIFRRTKKGFIYLLLKRSKTKIYEHLWQGVAGKIEKKEKSWEAAIRELKEETGFLPSEMFVADHVSRFYEAYKDRINLVPVFGIGVEMSDVKLSDEHCDYKWVDFNSALKKLVWKGQKEGLSAVHNMLNSNDDRMRWSKISID
jgi:dATP pyrophosphohydrolase|tara:strand:+ start:3913 stop:4377 length:465 start_codon:yes stop_codon:yes gene_type:complete